MSLFKRLHLRTVPSEFLSEGDQGIHLRFSQLNAKKMAKAKQKQTLEMIEEGNAIAAAVSEEARKASIAMMGPRDSESSKKRAQEKEEEPDTFDDFDQHTLVALAHVEHKTIEGEKWVELTSEQIDDLLCLEWLAGQIYDVSKPKSAKAREKNS